MKIKYSAGDKVFRIICFIIMGVFALSYIMILIYMIFGSFRTTTAFSQKPFNFFDISLNAIKRNYTKAFTYKVGGHTPMPKMILNSLIYVGGIVVLSVTIPAISGYITAKYDFKIKKLITSIAIITLVVPTIGSVTYRVKFDAKNGAWTVDKKGICESADSFANVLTVANSFTSSNTVGLACYTKDEKSATAVIDNLVITNNSGKYEYVRNIFSGLSSIKDGSMKTLATNALSGEKSTLGKTYIQKSWLCNVRFIAENGEILSSQKVSGYGTATAPVAPAKEGYTFKCWNKTPTGIITDSVFYPIYEEKTIEPDESSSVQGSTKESTDFSSSVSSVDSGKTSSGGCGGGVASVSVLSVAAVAASIAIWRKRRK